MPRWSCVELVPDDSDPWLPDRLLLSVVAPTTAELRNREAIDRYFFLRYFHGDFHIRFRLRLTSHGSEAFVNRTVVGAAARAGVVCRAGVYEPELTKYGGPEGLDVAEQYFTASSAFALDCLDRTVGSLPQRLMIAMQAFQALLLAGGLDVGSRARLLASYGDYWRKVAQRIHGSAPVSSRPDNQTISWLRAFTGPPSRLRDFVGEAVGSGLDEWCEAVNRDVPALRALASSGRLTTASEHVLGHLAHTFHNRLGLGVVHETIIADHLLAACEGP